MSGRSSRSSHTSSNQPKKTSLDDAKSHVEDDCFVDSGLISGENLSCEQFESEEYKSDTDCRVNEDNIDEDIAEDYEPDMGKIDSGFDIGESFSDLHLENEPRNNLNSGQTDIQKSTARMISNISPKPEPWELYFRQDDNGDTQLHIAIVHGMTDAVLALLHMRPHPSLLDVRNDSGRAPIHLAVLTEQPHIARRLLIAGAKVNTRDAEGNTALHLASSSGDIYCLRALTAPLIAPTKPTPAHNSQVPAARSLPHALDQKNYDGETCVHLAALGGHIDILRYLVWYGANINATENKSGKTALHIAIECGNLPLLRYLVTETLVFTGARTYAGRTALQLGQGAVREQLLAAGYQKEEDESENEDSDSDSDSEDDNELQYGNANYFNDSLRGGEAINVA